jgi:hypothetical protein
MTKAGAICGVVSVTLAMIMLLLVSSLYGMFEGMRHQLPCTLSTGALTSATMEQGIIPAYRVKSRSEIWRIRSHRGWNVNMLSLQVCSYSHLRRF